MLFEQLDHLSHSQRYALVFAGVLVALFVILGVLLHTKQSSNEEVFHPLQMSDDLSGYDNQLINHVAGVSLRYPDTWSEGTLENYQIPKEATPLFSLARTDGSCAIAYADFLLLSVNDGNITQGSYSKELGRGPVHSVDRYILPGHLLSDQSVDAVIINESTGYVPYRAGEFKEASYRSLPWYNGSLLLLPAKGGMVTAECDREFENITTTLQQSYTTARINMLPENTDLLLSETWNTQTSQLRLFSREENGVTSLTYTFPHAVDNITFDSSSVWYIDKDGLLTEVNLFTDTTSVVPLTFEPVEEGAIHSYYVSGTTLYYLYGKNCLGYRESCSLQLYAHELHASKKDTVLADNLSSRRVLGIDRDTNTLYLQHGEGDAGCAWMQYELINLASMAVEAGPHLRFSYCYSEDVGGELVGDDLKNANAVDAIENRYAESVMYTNTLTIQGGKVAPLVIDPSDNPNHLVQWFRFMR